MDRTYSLLTQLKSKGYRMTKARSGILHILKYSDKHLTANDILINLKKIHIIVNKTTVYREIKFLKQMNYIHELPQVNRKNKYELKTNHHHHIICKKCGIVKEFNCRDEILNIQKILHRKTEFNILEHTIEFYGFCNNCK